MPAPFTRVGVLLAGCGTHDGTDVGEALLTFLELERRGVQAIPLVPPGDQMHVVDHSTGLEAEGERRSMVKEAARITRGQVEVLGELPHDRLHALLIPGGGGTAKNLMTGFLQKGVRRQPTAAVRALLDHFLEQRKPIGLLSVANFLLVGTAETPVLPERLGTTSEPLVVDPERRLVYAPGFLTARSLAEVAEEVQALVELVLHWADEARGGEST